ncbi:hypothetical protein FKR81_02750 [Lentzea tibetensis]|uniref:Uncharacterized protein n=1 Tax=Lentzea tibetensis TaxID=2591470 RepID=A0A563F2V9_9PSEU|nr:hypothetical protein [Lentzea tibetensis]TWP53694.1 hypothetical protein FKR81_02750 [Lentzea tibetensis]
MALDERLLMTELTKLRKGRGVYSAGIDELVGPTLRSVCGIGVNPVDETVIRHMVIDWLERSVSGLPADVQLAVTVPFAIHTDARYPRLTDRIGWLAERWSRDPRTARRRVDDALRRLVQAAQHPANSNVRKHPRDTWHVAEFDVLIRLDSPTPTWFEHRTIVSDRDDVDQLELSVALPRSQGCGFNDLDVTVMHGAAIDTTERLPRRLVVHLRLPHPLRLGEQHNFALRVHARKDQAIRSEYVYWPDQRCERLTLRVRFGPSDTPVAIHRFDAVHHLDFEDADLGGAPVSLDDTCEATSAFIDLRPGFGYGVHWQPAD